MTDTSRLLARVARCRTWRMLYALADEFLAHGLYLGRTVNANWLLCRVEGGRPVHKSLFDDYLILGGPDEDDLIADELSYQVVSFVRFKAMDPRETGGLGHRPDYQQAVALYGAPIRLGGGAEAGGEVSSEVSSEVVESRTVAEQHIRAIGAFIVE